VPNVPPGGTDVGSRASRVVDWFLRPLSPDLAVVGTSPTHRCSSTIQNAEQQALTHLCAHERSARCDDHLTRRRPAPGDAQQLKSDRRPIARPAPSNTRSPAILVASDEVLSSAKTGPGRKGPRTLSRMAQILGARRSTDRRVKLAQQRGSSARAASSHPSDDERKPVKLRPEEITSILKDRIEHYDVETRPRRGRKPSAGGDGIARAYGLRERKSHWRMLEFEHGVSASAFTSKRTTSAPRSQANGSTSRRASPSGDRKGRKRPGARGAPRPRRRTHSGIHHRTAGGLIADLGDRLARVQGSGRWSARRR